MFEFVSSKLSSRKVFPVMDKFYNGWFTARNIDFDNVLEYFPDAETWDKTTLFAGLLWMYYNYPMDYLEAIEKRKLGQKVFRKTNLVRVGCFLHNAVDNSDQILTDILASNLKGKYPAARNMKGAEDALLSAVRGENFTHSEEEVIAKDPKHPFARMVKGIPTPRTQLKKRLNADVMFTNAAIRNDAELTKVLHFEYEKLLGAREFFVERRQKAKAAETQRAVKEQQLKEHRQERADAFRRLLDQLPAVQYVRGSPEPVVAADEPRHKVSFKKFVPFREDINIDIDPNMISEKIKSISIGSSQRSSSQMSSARSSQRSDEPRFGRMFRGSDEPNSYEFGKDWTDNSD